MYLHSYKQNGIWREKDFGAKGFEYLLCFAVYRFADVLCRPATITLVLWLSIFMLHLRCRAYRNYGFVDLH